MYFGTFDGILCLERHRRVNLIQRPKQLGNDGWLLHLTMFSTIPWIEC